MAGTEFRRYLEAICADPSFARRRRSYVPTDLLDRQQTNRSPIEQPDFFAEFVAFNLDLNVQTAQEEKPEGLEPEKAEKIERLPVLEGIRKYAADHVLLVGKPGLGKSTALERLLVQEAELALGNVQAPIPVLLKLRDLRTSVWDLLQLSLVSRDPNLETVDLATLLTSGRLLLLWDGVNELPTGLDELKELRQRYRQTPMIFTTRTLSAGSNLGIEKKLEMQPLTEPQMRQFTCNYLGKEKGDRLIQKLEQRLREFGETPLLLWMLCGIYSKAGQIPSNLGSVFRLFVSIYDQQKEFDEKTRLWQSRFLQALAFAMMPQGDPKGLRLSILKSEAVDLFVKLLEQETDPLTRAIDCLDDLLRYHLLQSKNSSEIEFRHQLFQEYYAAEHLLRQLNKLDDLTLKKVYLNSVDWTESLALMLSMLENKQQVLHITNLALEIDLKLCARLAGAVKPLFQQQIVEWIIKSKLPEWLKIELLGATCSAVAVSEIFCILQHENYDTCGRALKILSLIGGNQIVSGLAEIVEYGPYTMADMAITALGNIGNDQAVATLLQATQHKDSSIHYKAVQALGKIKHDGAVDALLKIIQNQSSSALSYAIEILGRIGSIRAITALDQLLHNSNSKIRYSVAIALGKLGENQAVPVLLEALHSGNCDLQSRAIQALGQIPDERIIEILLDVIHNGNFSLQSIAIAAIGRIGNAQALSILLQVICNDNTSLHRNAIEALTQIGNEQAILVLSHAIQNPNFSSRLQAIEALGRIGGEQSVTILLETIYSTNTSVRSRTALALGFTGNKRAIPALLQSLHDRNFSVRYEAALALGRIGSEQAAATLTYILLHDEDNNIRQSAAIALKLIGSKPSPTVLLQALSDEDEEVRSYAIMSLGKIGGKQAVSVLLPLLNRSLEEDSFIAYDIIEALGQIDSEDAVKAVIQVLAHEDWNLRYSAAEALNKMSSGQAVEGLVCALADEMFDVREKAAEALGKIAYPDLLQQLWQLCKSGNKEALDAISAIQERCRFYNNEIEQMDLPVALENAYSIMNQYTFPNAQEVKIFEKVDTYHD